MRSVAFIFEDGTLGARRPHEWRSLASAEIAAIGVGDIGMPVQSGLVIGVALLDDDDIRETFSYPRPILLTGATSATITFAPMYRKEGR
jgi:hypothetical protein